MVLLPPHKVWPVRGRWRLGMARGRSWIGNPRADSLRLWTIQTRGAYQVLRRDGVLPGGGGTIDAEDFAPAYRWLNGRANDLLPTSGPGLVWL